MRSGMELTHEQRDEQRDLEQRQVLAAARGNAALARCAPPQLTDARTQRSGAASARVRDARRCDVPVMSPFYIV